MNDNTSRSVISTPGGQEHHGFQQYSQMDNEAQYQNGTRRVVKQAKLISLIILQTIFIDNHM